MTDKPDRPDVQRIKANPEYVKAYMAFVGNLDSDEFSLFDYYVRKLYALKAAAFTESLPDTAKALDISLAKARRLQAALIQKDRIAVTGNTISLIVKRG